MAASSAQSSSAIPTSTCKWCAMATPTTTSASTARPPTQLPKPKRGKTAAVYGPIPTRFHPKITVTAAHPPRHLTGGSGVPPLQNKARQQTGGSGVPPLHQKKQVFHLLNPASNAAPATQCPSARAPPRPSTPPGPTPDSGFPQTATNATTASARTTARLGAIPAPRMKVLHAASAEDEERNAYG